MRTLAGEQHGLLSRPALLALGANDHNIGREMRSGRWTEVHTGVYYLNVTPVTWRTEVLAAVLAAGKGALASHRTAAVLMNIESVRTRMIEITVAHSDHPIPEGVTLHRTRRPTQGTVIDSIPVTSPGRTILDLAAILPAPTLEKVVSSAVRQGHLTLATVDETIRIHGGRGVTGTKKLRRVLQLVDGDLAGSTSEVDLNQLIREAPVPSPVLQLRVVRPDGISAYPDFSWPDRMKIVEADGLGAHWTEDQLQWDLVRQNQLMQLGWEIRRFSARHIRRDPQGVLDEIVRFINRPTSHSG